MTALLIVLASAAAVSAALLLREWRRRRAAAARLALHEAAHHALNVGVNLWTLEHPDDPGSLRLIASNPAAARATGVPLDEVVGKRIDEAFTETVTRGIAQEFADVARTGQPKFMGEVIYGDPRVTESIYEVYCFPLPGRSMGVAFDNITRRKMVELQIERSVTLMRLLAEVAMSANEAATAREALDAALGHVCRRAGWALGHAYRPAPDGLLESTRLWYLPEPEKYAPLREVTERSRLRVGHGLPGRVFETAEPDWTIDATLDGETERSRVLRELGLRAALAFPVLGPDGALAVMEFFAPRAPIPDEDLLNVMRQVGETLGHALARERRG